MTVKELVDILREHFQMGRDDYRLVVPAACVIARVSPFDISTGRRAAEVMTVRWAATYILREVYRRSYPEIASDLMVESHSTAICAYQRACRELSNDD